MSIGGPSPLGTLLVQRLDAVLGTTLSQQTNIVSGARPDAVSQPDSAPRSDAAENETLRHPRDSVDRATSQSGQQAHQTIDKTRLDVLQRELLAGRNAPNTTSTPSAPTTLGQAAKTILALLANYPAEASPVTGKAPLANPRSELPGASQGSATVGNAAARGAISSSIGATGSSTTIQGAVPLSPPIMAPLFAQALSQALQSSGMFYESHLNNLAFGKQSANSLLPEPQAQVGRTVTADATITSDIAPAKAVAISDAAEGTTGSGGSSAKGAESSQTGGATSQPASASGSAIATGPLAGLHPDTHLLVRQQLEVLATQTFLWRGEAWPNAPMEWEVKKREYTPGEPDPGVSNHWATRINIVLPKLGEVEARLNLVGQQLIMHLVAPQAANVLNEQGAGLRARYLAAGLQLSQLSIASDAVEPVEANDLISAKGSAEP